MPSQNVSSLLNEIIAIPRPFQKALARLLGFDQFEQVYRSLPSSTDNRPLAERLLQRMAVTYRASERDLQQIPREGATVIVANHPFGILEGAVLATVLARVRPDVRFLANRALEAIPEIRDLLIPVDVLGGSARSNATSLRRAFDFLFSGGCLVVFPAGEVSHFDPRERTICDPEWHSSIVRLIEGVSRRGTAVSTVPLHIGGSNSLLFHVLGLIHPRLRTALLVRELMNKRNRLVELRIGSPIAHRRLLEIPTSKEQTEYLRWRTYLLSNRDDFKARTAVPLPVGDPRRTLRNVRSAVDPALLATEVAGLAREQRLSQASDLEVYLTPASAIPNVLEEIGRLRELTFRTVGEGTGKSIDLDQFDQTYLHLFVWNAARKEVVGAYRLAGTDVTSELYTGTLFHYGDEFLKKLGPALELGRSFIRPEYQKAFAPLLALWKGIGSYVARNPRYKILFGPVSISNQYQAVSRELMVAFLERRASFREWAGMVSARNPFRRLARTPRLPQGLFDVEDLSQCVADLEPSRTGVPVLLRQYLKLGGELLGFNVDPEFSDALDGLIVVDLTRTEPRLLERYLGKGEASKFLHYQKGTHD